MQNVLVAKFIEVDMPYKVVKRTGGRPWKIINKETSRIVGSSLTKKLAEAAVRARYAHER
jgi:hypothetical protein